ncbi:HEPN domain-containing protein [Halomonas sp. HK25]|uniref:HEPN domain-containing protein n=1 Tax=Halomonas sp. HK25 TaxID=3394321 RepID=UPI0039FCE4CF
MVWNDSWPSRALVDLERSITSLEALVHNQDPSEPVSAELSRFLVVRTCGYLEQSIEECCRSYLKSKSDPRSAAFGESWLGRGANPRPDSLIKLVKRFDSAWADDLEALLSAEDELLKREIEYLVDKRNRISHGLNQGVGQRKALNLVPFARRVTNWFIFMFDPR